MSDRITQYFLERTQLELERFKLDDDLLKQANAGEVYYDTSNIVIRCITDCDGNDIEIGVGQWREVQPHE